MHICRIQCEECISNISIKDIRFTQIASNMQSNIPSWSFVDGETLVTRLATWYGCDLSAQPPIIEELEKKLATI